MIRKIYLKPSDYVSGNTVRIKNILEKEFDFINKNIKPYPSWIFNLSNEKILFLSVDFFYCF